MKIILILASCCFIFLFLIQMGHNLRTNTVEKEAPVNPIKYKITGEEVTITGGYSATGVLTIPATIEGKPVTSIGEKAFTYSDLTGFTIPDSVTSIEAAAFKTCRSLSSITIPDSVTSIGRNAFWNCSRLTKITIPDSVTSIGQWTFKECSSLTSITIGDGVTSIARLAFEDCSRLRAVTFLGDAPRVPEFDSGTPDERILNAFHNASPTIYRKPEAKGWGDTFAGRPVKLISDKP